MRKKGYVRVQTGAPPIKETPEPKPSGQQPDVVPVGTKTTVRRLPIAKPKPAPAPVAAPAGWEYAVVDVRLAAGTLGDGTLGWVAYGTLMRKSRRMR
jgi:hypothetical protein